MEVVKPKRTYKPRTQPRIDKGIRRVDAANARNNHRRIGGLALTQDEVIAIQDYAAATGLKPTRALYAIIAAGIAAVEKSNV